MRRSSHDGDWRRTNSGRDGWVVHHIGRQAAGRAGHIEGRNIGTPGFLLQLEPRVPLFGSPFALQVTVAQGIVVATNHTQVLTSADGSRETLTDAILVACLGVSPGESGGPAVDRAGKVVGVIEGGSGAGITTLAPVTDLTSLH